MDNQDRAALNAAFAAHVARVLGPQAAYKPAEQCPQGHPNVWADAYSMDPPHAIGILCQFCLSMYWWPDGSASLPLEDRLQEILNHADDPDWHPEWRIPPGEPQDFCASLDRTVPVLAALGLRWDVLGWMVRVWREATDEPPLSLVPQVDYLRDSEWGDPATWATALVRAALRVLAAAPRA
jgi:hypothetical protein